MDLFGTNTNPTFFSGQRIQRVKGYSVFEKIQLPKDCEAIFLDEDQDVCYIKKTDSSGQERSWMFGMNEMELPTFDPKKYVTVKDFESFKEECLNGINDIKQALRNGSWETE